MTDKNRFSIALPIDLSIKLSMELEKIKISKNLFIIQAVKEKLDSTAKNNKERDEIKKLWNEINKIKEARV